MKQTLSFGLLLATMATSALADGPYIVGEITHSNLSMDKHAFDQDLTAAGATGLSSSDDGSANQWRLQAGYKFNPYLAVEAGYIDLGKANYKANFAGGNAKGSEKAGGVDLAVLGIYPATDNLSLFAKGGVIAAKVETKLEANTPTAVSLSDSSYSVRPLLGAGVTYNMAKNIDFRFDYDYVPGIHGTSKGGKMDDNMVSAGISYNF